MTQMTGSQARVVDPVLTSIALGYSHPLRVGRKLFPEVPVAQRGGKIIQFDKRSFLLLNTRRSPGAKIKRVQYGYEGVPYSLYQHSLAAEVPQELLEEAQAVPGINLSSVAVNNVMDAISLQTEYEQAQIARNASNYGTNNKITLSGSGQWSHADSNPAANVEVAKEAVRASTGHRPNIAVIGSKVLPALNQHARIIDRIKYTGRDSISLEMLAALWGIDEVVEGASVYADPETESFVDVWGKDVVFAYVAPASLADRGTPSYAYTYRLKNHPLVKQGYFDPDVNSWVYPTFDELSPVLTCADAGYLMKNVVQ